MRKEKELKKEIYFERTPSDRAFSQEIPFLVKDDLMNEGTILQVLVGRERRDWVKRNDFAKPKCVSFQDTTVRQVIFTIPDFLLRIPGSERPSFFARPKTRGKELTVHPKKKGAFL